MVQENKRKEGERRILQKLVNFVIILIILAHPTQITVGQAVKWLGFLREEEPVGAEQGETAEGQQTKEVQPGVVEGKGQPTPAEGQKVAAVQKATSSTIEKYIRKILSINFTLADLLIWLLLPLWLLKALIYREVGSIKLMPFPVFALLGLCLASVVIAQFHIWNFDLKSTVKETIQYVEFFAIAYLLLINNITSFELLRKLTYILFIVVSFVIALGLLEYFHKTEIVEVKAAVEGKEVTQEFRGKIVEESEDTLVLRTKDGEKKIPKKFITKREGTPFGIELPKFRLPGMKEPLLSFPVVRYAADIDSTFGFPSFMKAGAHEQVGTKSNRNVLSGYLCIVVPLMWGIVLYHKGFLMRLWMLLGVIGGLLITLNGGAFLAILLAILVMSFIKSGKTFGIVVTLLVIMAILSSHEFDSWCEEWISKREIPEWAKFTGWKLPRDNATILLDSLMLAKIRDDYGALPEPFKGRDDVGDTWSWQQRFVEWQPAMIMIKAQPVFGVGIGNYQENIDEYYNHDNYFIEKPSVNLMEPDALNYYLVLGAELGIPGILAFLWILLYFSRSALESFSRADRGLKNALAFGVLGSLLAFSITSIFTPMIIRGVAIAFVFLLALATILKNLRAIPAESVSSSTSTELPKDTSSETNEIPLEPADASPDDVNSASQEEDQQTDVKDKKKMPQKEIHKVIEPDKSKDQSLSDASVEEDDLELYDDESKDEGKSNG